MLTLVLGVLQIVCTLWEAVQKQLQPPRFPPEPRTFVIHGYLDTIMPLEEMEDRLKP